MRMPRMTGKRWFWTLTGVLAVYMVIALRMDTGTPSATSGQSGVAGMVHTLLSPAQWAIGKVTSFFSHAPAQTLTPEQIAQLQADNKAAQSQLSQLQTQLDQMQKELQAFTKLMPRYPALTHAKFLTPVNIVGFSTSANTDTFTLDAGATEKVEPGMLVVANFAPVGQVISVGPTSSVVRLISDPSPAMRIRAQIVRMNWQTRKVESIADICQVEGVGQGQLVCRSVSVNSRAPEPGDVVVVNGDKTWKHLDGAYIGEIDTVEHLPNPDLRFNLKIRSYADLPSLRRVTVILE